MISVLILTRNEELDLPACLDSVSWSGDVHVLDSQSTDRTRDIAAARGITVTVRPFDTYAAQRNAGLALPFRNPWVLVLDADERIPSALSSEMQQAVAAASPAVAAFRLQRRDFLWGTWLKHTQMTPFYVRLLRVGRARYVREVNEVIEVDGDVQNLTQPFDHFPFSKGIHHWIAKHNTYSTMEAQLLVAGTDAARASLRQALFARNFHDRRVAQKAIFYRMPARPLVKWLYLMFVRGALLDGRAGITCATLIAFYEYLIEAKARELRRKQAGLPI
jgi:glycosyltransferase involved in cell wall biosynthesis